MKFVTLSLLTGMILLTACSTSKIGNATDSALCSELKDPIDQAVNTTLEYSDRTPAPVINDWATVTRGFDKGCESYNK